MKIAAGEFKAKCLRLMETVRRTRGEIVITKRGRPIAKLTPILEEPAGSIFGWMQGTVEVRGDIVEPIKGAWNAQR
jgi:prevent-host-death family protein